MNANTTAPSTAAAIFAALSGPAARPSHTVVEVSNDRVDLWDRDGNRVSIVARAAHVGPTSLIAYASGSVANHGQADLRGVPASAVAALATAMLDEVDA